VAKLVRHVLTQSFRRSWLTRLSGLAATPILRDFRKRVDPRRYNGASLLGLRGIVIKSHGGADQLAFENAIHIAEKEIYCNVPERIAQQVANQLGDGRTRATA
jgi:glycerol-3-phosphate acyltransferase PlsX